MSKAGRTRGGPAPALLPAGRLSFRRIFLDRP